MKYFAVTGKPIFFSKSPEIFKVFFNSEDIDAHYFRLAADSAKDAIDNFKMLGLSGMNVTAPFKTEIIKYLDDLDELARKIGGVNTVVKKGNKLIGYNTDYYGVIDSLHEVNNKTILLLGAGGAAKAVAYALNNKAQKIFIANRTIKKAEELANSLNLSTIKIEEINKILTKTDIIVNTLPQGVKLINDEYLPDNIIFFDAIYHKSAYKQICKQKGIKFISGKSWLINQAKRAFELFFDKTTNLDESCFVDDFTIKEKIILIGFMGSGKSSIGKKISENLNEKFFSTDDILTTKESKSILQIFEEKGEKYFREVENQILQMLSSMGGKAIVASGGGVVLSEENRKLLKDNFYSIWLYSDIENIMKRVNPESRPILKDNFTEEKITELFNNRMSLYKKSADLFLNTSNKTIDETLKKIFSEINSLY